MLRPDVSRPNNGRGSEPWRARVSFMDSHLDIILLEERQHAFVIFEGDSLGCGERLKWRHISLVRRQGLQNCPSQIGRVELEVGLEQEIDDGVDAPYSRLCNLRSAVISVTQPFPSPKAVGPGSR